jgi:K+-sensing histidine kinase KdpD
VHHVSYELRSPLTNIIGFAHFLGDSVTGPLNDKQREYLGYITVSTNALLAIINDILDLATIDAGAMTLNLGAVDIRKTWTRRRKASATGWSRATSRSTSHAARHRQLRRATSGASGRCSSTCCSNAVGFSPRSTIRLRAQRQGCDRVLGHRSGARHPGRDEGPHFRLVRDPSARLAASRSRLGLSIVRSFVELHGGTVTLDSDVGRGTTVICAFRSNTAPNERPPPDPVTSCFRYTGRVELCRHLANERTTQGSRPISPTCSSPGIWSPCRAISAPEKPRFARALDPLSGA